MKRKIIALLLCIVCVVSLCFPVAADDDGYSAIVSDIDKTCPTCGATLHASWGSTSGAEVELEISDTGKVKIPAGAGAFARIHLRCSSCGYEKTETRLLGLDFGAEKPGKLVQAPSGIGRKDLPGYSDNNVPDVSQSGQLHFYAPVTCWGITGSSNYYWISSGTPELVRYNTKDCEGSSFSSESEYSSCVARAICAFTAPVSGTYYIYKDSLVADYYWRFSSSDDWKKQSLSFKATKSASFNKGEDGYVSVSTSVSVPIGFNAKGYGVDIYVSPLSSTINKQTNITINNDYSQTWNGNIYTDNSTNLTYIYPQYTTVNEKNETVTNISNTPIIYNNETKKYYTYDTVTNNYYYISYEPQAAPTPSPSSTPAPTDKPGGSISTPETGKPGGSSGSSWWDKLLSKIGDAILDGLHGSCQCCAQAHIQAAQYNFKLDYLGSLPRVRLTALPAARIRRVIGGRRSRLLRYRHYQIYSGVTICVIHFCCSCQASGSSACIT